MKRSTGIMVVAAIVAVAGIAAVAALSQRGAGDSGPRSWGSATAVPVPSGAVGSTRATVDPAGVAHVLYVDRRDGAANLREITRAPGGDWSDPTTITEATPFDVHPVGIAANNDGDATAIWAYSTGRRRILMASSRTADGPWEAEQALSRVSSAFPWAQAVVAPDGTTTIVARGLVGPGLWAVRHEAGGPWQPAQRIAPRGLGTDSPVIALAADGRVGVVALEKRPGIVRSLFSVTATPDGRWGPPQPIPASDAARTPVVAFAAGGDLIAGWRIEAGGSAQIRGATLPPAGRWSSARTHDTVPKHLLGALVVAGVGGERPMLTWARWRQPASRRRAEIRAAGGAAGPTAATVTTIKIPDVAAGPYTPRGSLTLGPPPLYLLGGTGTAPTLIWGRPSTAGSAIEVTAMSGGAWASPATLSDGSQSVYPTAIGNGDGSQTAIWAAGPPQTAVDRLLTAER